MEMLDTEVCFRSSLHVGEVISSTAHLVSLSCVRDKRGVAIINHLPFGWHLCSENCI